MITPKVMHLAFTKDEGALDFIPGQFITFHIPDPASEKMLRRSYSVSTIPGQEEGIGIAAAFYEEGVATDLLFHLKTGDNMDTTGPFGRLVLREEDTCERYILVATGTGVSPYRAMLPQIAEKMAVNPQLQVHIILGVQGPEHLLYGDDFAAFDAAHERFHFHACYSRQQPETPRDFEYEGHVQQQIDGLNPNPEKDMVYLCGNPNMIDDAFALLQEYGFDHKNVRREKYVAG